MFDCYARLVDVRQKVMQLDCYVPSLKTNVSESFLSLNGTRAWTYLKGPLPLDMLGLHASVGPPSSA